VKLGALVLAATLLGAPSAWGDNLRDAPTARVTGRADLFFRFTPQAQAHRRRDRRGRPRPLLARAGHRAPVRARLRRRARRSWAAAPRRTSRAGPRSTSSPRRTRSPPATSPSPGRRMRLGAHDVVARASLRGLGPPRRRAPRRRRRGAAHALRAHPGGPRGSARHPPLRRRIRRHAVASTAPRPSGACVLGYANARVASPPR
jgi:hypothetical protein